MKKIGSCDYNNLLENGLCNLNGDDCLMHGCILDAFNEPERNCCNCDNFKCVTHVECDLYPNYSNLKSFPFKKEMDCFE